MVRKILTMSLPFSFPIGCILLGGLFVYDIFWVFGTDVMVTVATSFEAPIKLLFPMDFMERGLFGKNFAMLGLGDIVIPGMSNAHYLSCLLTLFPMGGGGILCKPETNLLRQGFPHQILA